MIRILVALAFLLFGLAPAIAQKGTPTLQIDSAGTTRNLYLWDLTKPGTDKGVSIGYIDTTAHAWYPVVPASTFSAYMPGWSTSVQNTGVPGLDGGRWFISSNPAPFDGQPTLRVDRVATTGTGLTGNTYKSIWGLGYTGEGDFGFEWTITGEQHNQALASNGAQNVAVNGTIFKEANGVGPVGASWGGNFVCNDTTSESDPVASCIGAELDVYSSAATTDANRQRVALQVAAGTTATTGTAHFGYGVLMGTTSTNSVIDRAFATFGSYGIGLDFTNGTFATAPIFLTTGQKIVLDGSTSGTSFRSISQQVGAFAYGTQNGNVFTIDDNGVISSGRIGAQGGVKIDGQTSGVISILPQAAAGTYNFNLPTTAGTSGQVLASAGGGASPMTWITPTTLSGVVIASLPTCTAGLTGTSMYVTNGQTSPTYLGVVSTTGAVTAPVFCNGSNWVYH